MFMTAPNAPQIKVVTHGRKTDDNHLQYTVTQQAVIPNPNLPPPPAPVKGSLVRCSWIEPHLRHAGRVQSAGIHEP